MTLFQLANAVKSFLTWFRVHTGICEGMGVIHLPLIGAGDGNSSVVLAVTFVRPILLTLHSPLVL